MSKTQEIRDALAGGPKTFSQLHGEVGGDDMKLKALLGYLRKNNEIEVGDDDDRTITLKSGGGSAAARKGKKPAREKRMKRASKVKRAGKAKRVYQRLADKHAPKHANGNGAALHALALDNLVAASQDLRRAIGDLGDLPAIGRAVRQYDLAEKLHDAAKQA